MSLALIRAAVVTILEGVTGIGAVHNYERLSSDLARLKSLHVVSNRINSWTVTRTATTSEYRTNTQYERQHQLVIRGYMSLDDAAESELTFQALVEAIEEAFRGDDTLDGTAEVCGPLQVERVEPVMFAGVLCHFAELRLMAQELVT